MHRIALKKFPKNKPPHRTEIVSLALSIASIFIGNLQWSSKTIIATFSVWLTTHSYAACAQRSF